MIEISNLSFGYSKSNLLYEDLSLTIDKGYIYGLLGMNGAGKSTLLKNIAGTLFPLSGSVKIDSLVPRHRKPSFLRTVYYIPEEVYVPSLTAKQYVSIFSPFYPNFNKSSFRQSLEELGVSIKGRLTSLSFGQQKKFIIAFALACNTKIVLMDEPTNGLDIQSKSQFRQLIATVMSDERTILISTHQTRDLENLIDKLIIVNDGRLIVHATMDEISEKFYFDVVEEIPVDTKILYREDHLRGAVIVRENKEKEYSRINLEHFFNGATSDPS
ncbi:ABC-2 type transport system ATP-binding protein [Pedobacter sp. UYP24]